MFLAGFWKVLEAIAFKPFLTPSKIRVWMLRMLGASVGKNVLIKSQVKILFPWNLQIGSNTWIGEGVWVINHEKVTIANDVCVSQGVIICSSGHDYRTTALIYKHSPIYIDSGAWICLSAKLLPGSKVGKNSVISANEVLRDQLKDNHIFQNGIQKPIDYRYDNFEKK
jgi:putative colanic acid biosynthesis acetyltransferase WcaF